MFFLCKMDFSPGKVTGDWRFFLFSCSVVKSFSNCDSLRLSDIRTYSITIQQQIIVFLHQHGVVIYKGIVGFRNKLIKDGRT